MGDVGDVVMSYEQPIRFVVGFAGSGKSTHLASKANKETLVLTPTHKAAGVLINKGVENVYTIHALLGLVPTLDQNYVPGKQRMQRLRRVGSKSLDDITDIFIDEFSMINVAILDLLLDVLPAKCRVTVYGDDCQLPPVDGEAIDPLDYTEDIEHLTTQHRAEAPEVVETFMRFMNYISDGSEKNLKMNPNIKGGPLSDFNPETDRVLAYTNAKTASLNRRLAEVLGVSERFSEGDKLLANQLDCILTGHDPENLTIFPKCMSKGKLMDSEKLEDVAHKTQEDIVKYRTAKFLEVYSCGDVVVGDKSYHIYYDTDHYQTQKGLKADVEKWQAHVYDNNTVPEDVKLKDWCYKNRNAPGVKERGQAWSHYIAHSSLVFNLQRPWATTVHKAQGSEFDTVYIAQTDIKKSIQGDNYMAYARLMYVALSRAINKVVIVS